MIVGDGTTAEYTRQVFGGVDWLWICTDTPILADGKPDYPFSRVLVEQIIEQTDIEAVVISTQLPVGTCALFEQEFPDRRFAVIPENYRTTNKVATVDRLIVGSRVPALVHQIRSDLAPPMVVMSPESAEMVKHGINGFLALSVQYAHELARIARLHGADPDEVARGLQSDTRIGERSYLKPEGEPGPHLVREIHTLAALGGGPLINTLEATCWPS